MGCQSSKKVIPKGTNVDSEDEEKAAKDQVDAGTSASDHCSPRRRPTCSSTCPNADGECSPISVRTAESQNRLSVSAGKFGCTRLDVEDSTVTCLDGIWHGQCDDEERGEKIWKQRAKISGLCISWVNGNGSYDEFTLSDGKIITVVVDNCMYRATLTQDHKLEWDDGDVWFRVHRRDVEAAPPSCARCNRFMSWTDYSEGDYSSGWSCDRCRKNQSERGPHRWFCKMCKYDYCAQCEQNSKQATERERDLARSYSNGKPPTPTFEVPRGISVTSRDRIVRSRTHSLSNSINVGDPFLLQKRKDDEYADIVEPIEACVVCGLC